MRAIRSRFFEVPLGRPAYKDIIVESLDHCQREKGLLLYAWCIMSDHVHLIAKAAEGSRLQDILRDHKKFTAKQVVWILRRTAGGSVNFTDPIKRL